MRINEQEYNRLRRQTASVMKFLDTQFPKLSRDQWWQSYQSWARGGNGWNRYSLGGTYINGALAWYQHVHKPGCHEWRPPVIMRAVIAAATQEERS